MPGTEAPGWSQTEGREGGREGPGSAQPGGPHQAFPLQLSPSMEGCVTWLPMAPLQRGTQKPAGPPSGTLTLGLCG